MKINTIVKNIEDILGENLLLVNKENKTEYKSEKIIGYTYKILLVNRKYEAINVSIELDGNHIDFKEDDTPKNVKLISPSIFIYSLQNSTQISTSFKAESIALAPPVSPTANHTKREVIANV